jgi:hypothetical protein
MGRLISFSILPVGGDMRDNLWHANGFAETPGARTSRPVARRARLGRNDTTARFARIEVSGRAIQGMKRGLPTARVGMRLEPL